MIIADSANLKLDVKCLRPDWALTHQEPELRESFYRIFLDNDLMTERTWIWSNDHYIRENIFVNLDRRFPHTLTLKPIVKLPDQAKFFIGNFTCDNYKIVSRVVSDTEIQFNVR